MSETYVKYWLFCEHLSWSGIHKMGSVVGCAVVAARDKGEPNDNLGSVKINRPQ
jgi:hypothetical protein